MFQAKQFLFSFYALIVIFVFGFSHTITYANIFDDYFQTRSITLATIPTTVAMRISSIDICDINRVIISEFRLRGPNGGNDEFIELLNTSKVSVNISG